MSCKEYIMQQYSAHMKYFCTCATLLCVCVLPPDFFLCLAFFSSNKGEIHQEKLM